MRYKHFKNAGVDISALAVGTWAIGGARYGEVNDNDSIDAIHAMIDAGVNLIPPTTAATLSSLSARQSRAAIATRFLFPQSLA